MFHTKLGTWNIGGGFLRDTFHTLQHRSTFRHIQSRANPPFGCCRKSLLKRQDTGAPDHVKEGSMDNGEARAT